MSTPGPCCHICGLTAYDMDNRKWHRFRNLWICSGKCSNQLMRRFEYKREKAGTIRQWRIWTHGGWDRRNDPEGSRGLYRRWIHFGDDCFSFEISFGRSFCHLDFDVGCGDDDYKFSVAIPGFAIWLGLQCRTLAVNFGRETGIQFHNGGVWWNFWTVDGEWSSRTPKWRHGNFNFVDFLLGKMEHKEEVLKEEDVVIRMPEGDYNGHAKLVRCTWYRKRLRWWRTIVLHTTIDIPEGIPHAGKGTESYNCGDDATYGLTCTANTIMVGVYRLIESVIKTRERYGLPTPEAFLSRGKRILIPESTR